MKRLSTTAALVVASGLHSSFKYTPLVDVRPMIDVICHRCGKEMSKPGAILLSPPLQDMIVTKHDLCDKCYEEILLIL
jgi:hypothetical protein